MVFAQMIVEAPKSGASRRAAAISVPRLVAPPTKTRASSGASGRRSGTRGGTLGSGADGASSVPLGSMWQR